MLCKEFKVQGNIVEFYIEDYYGQICVEWVVLLDQLG